MRNWPGLSMLGPLRNADSVLMMRKLMASETGKGMHLSINIVIFVLVA